MGPPQWSDVGMYLQNVFLLSKEYGLDTCAQESWAVFHELVHKNVSAPKNLMLFCGIAIGYMDNNNPINDLRTERAPLDEIVEGLVAHEGQATLAQRAAVLQLRHLSSQLALLRRPVALRALLVVVGHIEVLAEDCSGEKASSSG